MSRIKTLLFALTLVLLSSASCQRKDLMEPHDHNNLIIKADFDSLGLAQLLTYKSGYSNPGEPKTTSYALYEKNTGKLAYQGYFDGLEGAMYIQEGLYDLLVYTTDFNEYDANYFIGMDRPETAETHTRQAPLGNNPFDDAEEEASEEGEEPEDKAPRSDIKEVWMVEPDPTFGVLVEDVAVFKDREDKIVEVLLVQKSFKYYLTIKALGLHQVHTATMDIAGMYTTAFLGNESHRMDEAGTQTVQMEIHYDTNPDPSIDNGYIYGEFWSFGPNQREDIINSITLYFVNGHVIRRKLDDLTEQIKSLDRGGEIIVEQVLEIKGPPSGFQPDVGDWENSTDVDIIL